MHCFFKTETCHKPGFFFKAATLGFSPVIILVLIIMSGCAAVGPEFQAPNLPAPDTWHTEMAGGLAVSETIPDDQGAWWQVFQDPLLTRLVENAAAGNLDLQKAVVRIEEARALYGISQADDYPVLDSTGVIQRLRPSEKTGFETTSGFYQAGFDTAWEMDIFGKIHRSQQAALAEVETRQQALAALLVSLQAEVALNYLELRTFQERLIAARGNLDVQKETYEINLSRFNAGLIGELAVHQAQYILEQTRSQIPQLQDGLGRAANRLAVLVGERPGTLHEELTKNYAIPCIPLEVVMGIPARTLRQRPDIRRAERALARETALVGVAMADLYPQLQLTGTFGLEALSVGNFFNSSSRFWGIGPRVSWRLFDGGRIRQAVAAQSARQEQAMIDYQAALLTAQEEIENAILAFAKEQLRRDSLVKATAAARNADRIARDQYQAGLVDFSNVLDAQRSLLSFEDQLAQSRGAVSANLVRLYKALGGGWQHMAQ